MRGRDHRHLLPARAARRALPARQNVRVLRERRPPPRPRASARACAAGPRARAGLAARGRGTSATVARALRLIDEGALDGGVVESLADRLGVTSRWLRQLFARAGRRLAARGRAHAARAFRAAAARRDGPAARRHRARLRLRERAAAARRDPRDVPPPARRAQAARRAPGDGRHAGQRLALRLPVRAPFDAGAAAARSSPRARFPASRTVAGATLPAQHQHRGRGGRARSRVR